MTPSTWHQHPSLLQAHTFNHTYVGNSSHIGEPGCVALNSCCSAIRGHSQDTHNCNTDEILKMEESAILVI